MTILATAGCDLEADRRREQEAAAARAAQVAREQEEARVAEEKSCLLRKPDVFLETSDLGYFDKGIINDYRQLTQMSVLNKSAFPVGNLQGEVDWMSEDGTKAASVPFTLKGSIPAGDTKTVSSDARTPLTNGTLQTSAKRARIRFTTLAIIEPPR